MTFASVVELEEYMSRYFTPSEYPRATRALIEATQVVRDACDWPLGLQEDREVTIRAPYGADVRLARGPIDVSEVVSIGYDGVETVVGLSEYVTFADGTLRSLSGTWGGPNAQVRVTFTSGDGVVPDVLRSLTLAAAARHIANPAQLESEALEDLRQGYGPGHGIDLTEDEMNRLTRAGYRSTVASVPIGQRY